MESRLSLIETLISKRAKKHSETAQVCDDDELVKLLSSARSCAKVIIDVAAVKFRYSAVKFVEKLLFDEAEKKVSITTCRSIVVPIATPLIYF